MDIEQYLSFSMPRTKYVRSSKVRSKFSSTVTTKQEPPESRESSQSSPSIWLSTFESDISLALLNYENKTQIIIEQIDQIADNEFLLHSSSILKKTMLELRTEKSLSSMNMKSAMFETASLLRHLNCTTNTTFQATRKKKQPDDEGYLTAGSTGDSSRVSRPRSSSVTRKSREPKRVGRTRASRSLSRSQVPPRIVTIQAPEKVTPEKRMRPPMAFGMVTPKVKPNMPVSVLRRPMQGEMAISMQGSPLLVSGVVTETCANVNIPLNNGRILSLQPSTALRMSEIPQLDENTRMQLKQLRDNLNRVVELKYDN